MNFIIMTLSFTVGILLASTLACIIMLNKKVMKAYLKYINKVSRVITEELFDED